MISEIHVQAQRHPSDLCIVVPLVAESAFTIFAVLDTGAPISAIRPSLASRLEADGLLDPSGPPLRFRIRDLTADNQALPLIAFGLLRRLERIDVDALLGLDFLSNFEEIRFNTKTLQLTLIR